MSRSLWTPAILGTALLAAGLQCSLVTSLDDLTGGEADAADVTDGSNGNDVVGEGGDSGLDAATEASTTDAGNGPFCAARDAFFCTDFDDAGLMNGWSTLHVEDGSTSTLDDAASVSAPFSYLAIGRSLPTLADTTSSHLMRALTTAPPHVIYSFDIRVDHFASNNVRALAASLVVLGAVPNTGYSVQLNLGESGSRITEQIPIDAGSSTGVDHLLAKAPALGVWTRVTIDVVFSGGPRTVTVSLDGEVVLDHDPLAANANPGPMYFYLGEIYLHGPCDGVVLRYDNVTVDTP